MYLKAPPALRRIFQLSSPFPLVRSSKYGFGYSVGADFDQYIRASTSRHLKDMTEKFPSNILINSYDQNQRLTYQQVL